MAKTRRPREYKPEYAELAYKLTRIHGAIDKELAEFFGVHVDTIKKWKKRYAAFADALHDGKEIADSRVKMALYERALGYSHPDTHISSYLGVVTKTELIKHYPPDSVACIFWLCNRDSKNWRRSPVEAPDDTPVPTDIIFTTRKAVSDIEITNART